MTTAPLVWLTSLAARGCSCERIIPQGLHVLCAVMTFFDEYLSLSSITRLHADQLRLPGDAVLAREILPESHLQRAFVRRAFYINRSMPRTMARVKPLRLQYRQVSSGKRSAHDLPLRSTTIQYDIPSQLCEVYGGRDGGL
ncbi:hypothetical protein BJV74DRAFT_794449 [Russula compacta]|nr:hypothetical protein BJV74DRAFT_794449 [Russula compacta]